MVNAPAIYIDGRNIGQAQNWLDSLTKDIQKAYDQLLSLKDAYEVGRPYELKAEGHVPCEYLGGGLAGAVAGAAMGAGIGVYFFGIGALPGALIGGAIGGGILGVGIAQAGCNSWTLAVYDDWGTGNRTLIQENAGEPDHVKTMQVQFDHPGLHTITAGIQSGMVFWNKEDLKIAVVPIALYLPANKSCVILSPTHPSTVIDGECRKKSDNSLIQNVGLDVMDQKVYPFLKDDAQKAEQVDNLPYDPETGQTNIDKGYYGGFFDANNNLGYWSWQEEYWVDQAKGIKQVPRMCLTYVQPKDMRNPDISTWKHGRAYVPPIESEIVRRYFLDKGMTIYDIHMLPIPDSWLVGVPFIIGGSVKKLDDTMTDCSQGQAVAGVTVELLDNGNVVGSATTLPDGSYGFTYSTMNEGVHKLQTKVKMNGIPTMTDKYYSEERTVYIQGGSFFLTPTGLAIIGLIIAGGVATYIMVKG